MNKNEINMDFDERRWKLFLKICDKQNLDIKGESMKEYISNFKSAFHKAHNIVLFYDNMKLNVDKEEK